MSDAEVVRCSVLSSPETGAASPSEDVSGWEALERERKVGQGSLPERLDRDWNSWRALGRSLGSRARQEVTTGSRSAGISSGTLQVDLPVFHSWTDSQLFQEYMTKLKIGVRRRGGTQRLIFQKR